MDRNRLFNAFGLVVVLILGSLLGCPSGPPPLDGFNTNTNENSNTNANGNSNGNSTGTGSQCATFNVIDTRTLDPAVVKLYFQLKTCGGEPLAGFRSDQFRITEDGADVSIYESNQDFAPNPRCTRQVTVLLLDMSGSILESGNLAPLQQAAKAFIQTIAQGQSIAVYTFDGRADLQTFTDFTGDVGTLQADIDSLSSYEVVDSSTNLNGAVVSGLDVLADIRASLGSDVLLTGALVVFTDGTDQAARVSDSAAVSAADGSPHSVYTIGLGGEVDENHLAAIGKGGTYIATNATALDTAFASAAAAIEATAQSYYTLAYCSPKRAGSHDLELSLRDWVGSATYTFSASGFEGGCTAADLVAESECDSCVLDSECDDGNSCTTDACVDGACVSTDMDCDDGDACTTDACAGGACSWVVDCDDGNSCTTDTCDSGTGDCVMTAIQCPEGQYCQQGTGCAPFLTPTGAILALDLGDGVTMELVPISAGTFMMGSENGYGDETPVHSVTISHEFYIGRYEVTQAQWQAVMGSNPSNHSGCGNCPVEEVSWEDAVAFNEAVSDMTGYSLRLPTEAEWEYAARAGTTTEYSFGDDAGDLGNYAWYNSNSSSETHEVGDKLPNPWGLYDMQGNVYEWCQDVWHESYSGAPGDESAWMTGGDQFNRVLRGGSWYSTANYCRCANRGRNTPGVRNSVIGFRIASGT